MKFSIDKRFLFISFGLIFLLSLFIFLRTESVERSLNIESFKLCDKSGRSIDEVSLCQSKIILSVKGVGISDTIRRLESEGEFKGSCHLTSHYVGRALSREINDVERFIADNDLSLCSQGLLHGYLEGALSKGKTGEARTLAEVLCSGKGSGCIHGFGHSLSLSHLPSSQIAPICVDVVDNIKLGEESDILDSALFNCVAGYLMQEDIDNRDSFSSLRLKDFQDFCGVFSTSRSTEVYCLISLYRIYISFPEVPRDVQNSSNALFREGKLESDKIIDSKFKEFSLYCSTLKAKIGELCNLSLGMSYADHYSFNRDKRFLSSKVASFCGSNYTCYDGYFQIIISQIPSDVSDFFSRFCSDEVCSLALDNSLRVLK